MSGEIDPGVDAVPGGIIPPPHVPRREDAWAYTPEHRALLEQAHDDSRAGRVTRLTEADLDKLGSQPAPS